MTKSLARLRRLASKNKIEGFISFDPYQVEPNSRYRLLVRGSAIPLGKNAQAARFALNHMTGGKDA